MSHVQAMAVILKSQGMPDDLRGACADFVFECHQSRERAEAAWKRLSRACARHCLDSWSLAKAARDGGYGSIFAEAKRQMRKSPLRRAMERAT